ncbi:anthranilate phosphoribosyltransferase [soil metagenome]
MTAHGMLERLLAREELDERRAAELLVILSDPNLAPALAGALLAALRARGETPAEIRGFAKAMRARAVRPALPAEVACIDIGGTGGDDSGSLNLSTGAALVTAACGVPVAKQVHRAVSSRSGSADVVEAMGFGPLDGDSTFAACLRECGIGFLPASAIHPILSGLAEVRAALRVRTIFDLLHPLANPVAPTHQVIGASSPEMAQLLAEALAGLPIERGFVVHGDPGWDEPTPAGPFLLFDVRPDRMQLEQRDPLSYGIARCSPESLAGGASEHNAARLAAVLEGDDRGAHRDALLLGAALGLEVCGRGATMEEGLAMAAAAIDDGRAHALVRRLRRFFTGRRRARSAARGDGQRRTRAVTR